MNRLAAPYDPVALRDISETVFRASLPAHKQAAMLRRDNDGGVALRARAASLDTTTRRYLDAIAELGGDVSFARKDTGHG